MSRIVDFLKGILSLILILALLAGVPAILLVAIGFPLPTEMPSAQLIRAHIADGDVPDPFVIKALAVTVWIVWIQLAVAVLAEGRALIGGRAAGRAPVMPGLQAFAGRLVASTVLIVSAFTTTRSAVAPIVPIRASEAAVTAVPAEAHRPPASSAAPAPVIAGRSARPAEVATGATYMTTEVDNWWDLAERLLGDGMRWSELRNLNAGKTMLSGEVISDRTDTVRGGWQLAVPADADPRLLATPGPLLEAIRPDALIYQGPTGSADAGPGIPYQVMAGDNLWDIAERHLGDPFRWPEIFENSSGLRQPFGLRITDPNLIWPDSILWLPTDAVEVPPADVELVREVIDGPDAVEPMPVEASEVTAQDLRQAAAAASRHRSAGPARMGPGDLGLRASARAQDGRNLEPPEDGGTDRGQNRPERAIGPAGLTVGAGGLLVATGLLGMLSRARRLRLSEAGQGLQPAPPPPDLIDLETVLRNRADRRRATAIHQVIRSLTDRPIIAGEPLATPEVVRISGDRVEVVQRGSDPDLPAPWLTAEPPPAAPAGRSAAVLPPEFFPDRALADPQPEDMPAPLLVTIGGGLLLNLESVGVVAIDGPTGIAAGLVRSMVHELATGPARRTIDIRVSSWLAGAELHDHIRSGPLDGLAEELGPWLDDVELGLAATGGFSAYALRASGLADAIPGPTVIFADASEADRLRSVVDRARRPAVPLAVVFSGDLAGSTVRPSATLRLEDDRLHLDPYGFTAATQHLDIDVVFGAESLIDHAEQAPMISRSDHQAGDPRSEQPPDPSQVQTEETPEHDIVTELPSEEHEITDRAEDDDGGILIRVLGPLEFEGTAAALSDHERSLLTFLALVGPSTEEQIIAAVWAGEPIARERFEAVIDRLRTTLGPRFPESGDDRYRLRSVVTDLGSARRWITQAAAMSPDRARNLLQLALNEVRGRPFCDVGERHWQWIEDHRMAIATQATAMLLDACFDLCDSAYRDDDVQLAHWACEVGSVIDPLHETIATRRVQLLQLLGQPEAARAAVEGWETGFVDAVARPAPGRPRLALDPEQGASSHAG